MGWAGRIWGFWTFDGQRGPCTPRRLVHAVAQPWGTRHVEPLNQGCSLHPATLWGSRVGVPTLPCWDAHVCQVAHRVHTHVKDTRVCTRRMHTLCARTLGDTGPAASSS